jgi:hypothetical protein
MTRPNSPSAAFNRRPMAAPPIRPGRDMTPDEVISLDCTLTRLITNYATAEAAYLELSHRPYPPILRLPDWRLIWRPNTGRR